ncbi:hypothetical protein PLESTB_001488100 [Pleodorina starrii]|uniref:Uncharacterized protein n=1 Tax=Pleodorina starrii TaxID=330485 RepID=A0A9W6F8C8_9CHLO|nr:hypothetical protein PLESTM_001922400 [Pleodorina starrii]GLC59446.1 hypothetical protein PLESTB_001488100 [Pleodorina starrii]GLC66460.1 hypothetical protein PLESTF_000429900 [Pleodorina starrii]
MTGLILHAKGLTRLPRCCQPPRKCQSWVVHCSCYNFNVPRIQGTDVGLHASFRPSPLRRTWDPVRAATGSVEPELPGEPSRDLGPQQEASRKGPLPVKLLALIGLVLITGVSNRVLYRMALVPLRDHIFFLAQLQNLGYLAVYFTALWWRSRSSSGLVTPAMLRVNKWPLVGVGACEAVAQLLFMVGAAQLPGPLLPLVNQTYLVWSLVFASLILGARYSRAQLLGAALVLAGVCAAAVQPAALAQLLPPPLGAKAAGAAAAGAGAAVGAGAAAAATVELRYVAVCVACFAFPAIANCIKERVFRSFAAAHGRPLDIFVVNSWGSLFQAAFVLLLLPITTALKGIALADLPAHLATSLSVFTGAGTATPSYAVPLLALSYVAMNLVFNISILTLLRSLGSVTTTLVASSLVPLTIAAFTLPLPCLEPAVIGPNFVVGASLLMVGLITYNGGNWRALLAKEAKTQ